MIKQVVDAGCPNRVAGIAVQEMQRHSGSGHKHGANSPERLIVICIPHLGNAACTYVPVRAGGCGAGAVGGGVTRDAGT